MAIITIANSKYPEIFKWSDHTLHLTNRVYQEYLSIFIESLLNACEGHRDSIIDRLNHLPTANQQRIVESPETYNRLTEYLRGEESRLHHFLDQVVSVEETRSLSRILLTPEAVWSANGDFLCDVGQAEQRDADGWRVRGRFQAPVLRRKIPIDHHSPYARHPMPVAEFRSIQFGEPEAMSAFEEDSAVSLVTGSFEKLAEANPVAGQFITNYVNSIILRKSSRVDVFQSASRNAFIGQIVLLNPHKPYITDEYMAESLLHEAIHSLLWRAEILDHFLADPNIEMGVVASPWSGEKIFYYTLLQACFVWYGIFWFWNNNKSSSHFEADNVRALHNRARAGFLSSTYEATLRDSCENLKTGIFDVFMELQANVRAVS